MDYRSEKRLDGWDYIDNQNGGYYGIWWKLWRDDDKIKLEKKGLIHRIGTLYLQLTSEKKVSIRVSCNIQNYSKSIRILIEQWFKKYLKDNYNIDFCLPRRRSRSNTFEIGYISIDEKNYKERISLMELAHSAFLQSPEKFPK